MATAAAVGGFREAQGRRSIDRKPQPAGLAQFFDLEYWGQRRDVRPGSGVSLRNGELGRRTKYVATCRGRRDDVSVRDAARLPVVGHASLPSALRYILAGPHVASSFQPCHHVGRVVGGTALISLVAALLVATVT